MKFYRKFCRYQKSDGSVFAIKPIWCAVPYLGFKQNQLGLAIALSLGSMSSVYAQTDVLKNPTTSDVIPETKLETIVVTATRSEKTLQDTPIPVTVLDQKTLQANQARTLKDAIGLLPNVTLRQIVGKTGYEVVMQGLGGDQVLVLVDGLPLIASTGSTVNLNQYLNTEVEQIEVIQGASSAQYGSSAMGGVINVITKRLSPAKPISGQITLDMGSNGEQNPSGKAFDNNLTHLDGSIDARLDTNGNWLGRLSASYQDDKGLNTDNNQWARLKDASEQQQLTGKLVYRPDAEDINRQAWLETTYYQENDISRFNYYVAPKLLSQQRDESIDKYRYAMGFNYQFDKPNQKKLAILGGKLQASALYETYQSNSSTGVITDDAKDITNQRKADITTQLAQFQYDLPAWSLNNSTHLWQVGGQWQQDSLKQTSNGINELVNDDVERQVVEGYLQDDWLIGEKWEVVSGLRYQHDSDFGSYMAPKIAVKFNTSNNPEYPSTWRASIGKGYRVPNLKERYFVFDHSNLGYKVLGNPDLQPESSTSLQIGYQAKVSPKFSWAVNGFYNDIEDLIQTDNDHATYDGNIALYHYKNIANAKTYGGDISATWQITPTTEMNGSYTYTQTNNDTTDTPLVGRPEHIIQASVSQALTDKLQWINRVRYESKHLVNTATEAYSPDWWTWDSKLNYQLNPAVNLHFAVNNLLDEQRQSGDANDQRPVDSRQWLVGATVNF